MADRSFEVTYRSPASNETIEAGDVEFRDGWVIFRTDAEVVVAYPADVVHAVTEVVTAWDHFESRARDRPATIAEYLGNDHDPGVGGKPEPEVRPNALLRKRPRGLEPLE